jgi:hypothetical protein
MIRIIRLFPFIFLVSCIATHTQTVSNGFDAACNIFEEAGTKNLSPIELGAFIGSRLEDMSDLPGKEEVKSVYHSLFNVDPSKRYMLFKESAEISLKHDWDCAAMKEIYQKNL